MNTDQGSQFTSDAFTGFIKAHRIRLSMEGRGAIIFLLNGSGDR